MAHDEAQVRELARSYAEAWCSRDPERVRGLEHGAPIG
jgi:hypothetical protein